MGQQWTPNIDEVARDLRTVCERLDYLVGLDVPALRALYVVRSYEELDGRSGSLSEATRVAHAIEEVVCEAIDKLPEVALRRAASALFDFSSPVQGINARKENAAEVMPTGGRTLRSMNRSGYFLLTMAVAKSIYSLELIEVRARLEADALRGVEGDLRRVLEAMGVVDSATQLAESAWAPEACLRRVRSRLWFMGTFGSKWVAEAHVRTQLSDALRRIEGAGGEVRFLLLDPESSAFGRFAVHREWEISAEALGRFAELRHEHPCLSVKLYEVFPFFRLVFIDTDEVGLARNRWEREEYSASRYGWAAPHLVLKATAPWSLHGAFQAYYEDLWEQARYLPDPPPQVQPPSEA
jgi:hypothetical protein